jgi:hypothetical protein
VAQLLGLNQKALQDYAKEHDIPRPKQGGASGKWNGSWKNGRQVDKDGYILVRVKNHPFARYTPTKKTDGSYAKAEWGYLREHRLVMEHMLGRYLLPNEAVHHKDGNKQNNAPGNLELFSSNSEHLRTELTGKRPKWTPQGIDNQKLAKLNRAIKSGRFEIPKQ